jgi:hypothetical protein
MLGVYRLSFDLGRGTLFAIFVESEEKVKMLIESKVEVYFGEVEGKHSEVYGPIEQGELELLTNDESFVSKFQDLKLATGHNPFDYQDREGKDIADIIDSMITNQ